MREKNFYDQNIAFAKGYSRDITDSSSNLLKAFLLKQHIKTKEKVLDFGCANGLFLSVFSKESVQSSKITGVDISDEMLKEALNFAHNIGLDKRAKFLKADITIFNKKLLQNFDLCFCFSTIPMSGGLEMVIHNVYQYSKKGGIVILDIPGKWNLSHWYWQRYYRKIGLNKLYSYTLKEIKRKITNSDFSIESWHCSGFLDQYKYIPLLRRLSFMEQLIHNKSPLEDRDYIFSNKKIFRIFANRHFVVLRRD